MKDLQTIILEIEIEEREREYFTVMFVKKKLKIPVSTCPQCTKPFVSTPKSPTICIFCMRVNEKKTL